MPAALLVLLLLALPAAAQTLTQDPIENAFTFSGSGDTTEASGPGRTTTRGVRLRLEPTAVVEMDLEVEDTTECEIWDATGGDDMTGAYGSTASMTFRPSGSNLWNLHQTLTIRGVDDDIDDGDVLCPILLTGESDDRQYNGAQMRFTVRNVDDDGPVAGLIVAYTGQRTHAEVSESGTVMVRDGRTGNIRSVDNTDTFTVQQATSSIFGVSVEASVEGSDPECAIRAGSTGQFGNTARLDLSGPALLWNRPQMVTVQGVDDDVVDGRQKCDISLRPISLGGPYSALGSTAVVVYVEDNDTRGLTVAFPTQGQTELSTSEAPGPGNTATFDLSLASEPTATVTVNLSSSDPGEATVRPSILKFAAAADSGNNVFAWNNPQVVTVTGMDDNLDDGSQPYTITLDPSSTGDSGYNNLANRVLRRDSHGRVLARSLEVRGTNADDDGCSASSPCVTLALSSDGDIYEKASSSDRAATVTATLSDPPTAAITIEVSAAPSTFAAADDYMLSQNRTITFAAGSTTSADTVTITAVDDRIDSLVEDVLYADDDGRVLNGKLVTVSARVTAGTAVMKPGETLKIIEDDFAALVLDPVPQRASRRCRRTNTCPVYLSVKETGLGSTDTFRLKLNSEPTADVRVAVTSSDSTSSSDPGEGRVSAGGAAPAESTTLTFTSENWNDYQTVTLTGVDDGTADGDQSYELHLNPRSVATDRYDHISIVSVTAETRDTNGPHLVLNKLVVATCESGANKDDSFTVKLGTQPSGEVAVAVSSSDTDEATVSPGTLTFTTANWDNEQTVTVTGMNDTERDDDQAYTITLDPSGADYDTLRSDTVSGTNEDDGEPALSIDSPSVAEGDSGSASLTFTVTLNAVSGRPVTVTYADAGTGTATSGTDYTALPTGTLTFAAGTTSQTVTVSVTGDTTDEADETVIVTLSGATNAMIGTASGTGTITDDDGQPALAIDGPSVAEGDSGSASLTFTVTLNAVSGKSVTVAYADAGTGTATSGTDYTALTAGTLTFAAGVTSQTVTVSVTGDTTDEADETVIVTLSGATNATLGTASGTGTITDDDGEPALTISSPSVGEGDSGSAGLTFTVSLNAVSGKPVTVTYADAGTGTATSGTDYTALTAGTLTFAAGVTSQAVTVSVTGDTTDEEDETVIVTLSGATNAMLGTASGTGTITDDDGQPALTISSPSVGEGDSGSAGLTFTVTLNAVSGKPVTVNYADAGTGTATSGTDYTALTAGTLTFAAGVTSQAVTVSVTGDTTDEEDETVVVTLSGATNATLGTASGTGTITDDDGQPALAISSPSVGEGDSGAASLTFTVSLNAVSGKPVTVTYADAGTGTATSGTDYTALTAGTLTFAAGVTSQGVTVSVTGDTTDEEDETVVVTLSGATNATLGTADGTGTITDDDGEPALAIDGPSVGEGDSGSASLTFTVTLNAVSGKPVTVTYADAGTGTATNGTDYTALTAGTLTFAAGVTSQAVTVSVTGDTTDEEDETVVVTLSGATNATLGTASGTGTITDDDGQPALAISSPSVGEGDSGAASLTFTVSLNAVSGRPVTVTYADAGTGTATSGTDYTALTAGTLTFAAGVTSRAVTVSVTGDTTDEEDETVAVTLSGATNATLGTASGTGTITDDDGEPALAISSPSVGEGDSGAASLTFTVSLNAVSGKPVTVTYADAGTGTATSGTDYTALTAGTLTFTAGVTSRAVTVSVTGDTTDEEDETVVVTLSGATNATLGTASGTGTITDDDGEPALAISSPSVGEGDSGAASLTFTVTLNAVSGKPVTVTYADAGTGTATSGTDYTALTAGTLTFAAGVTSQGVTVSVTGDTTDEEDETVVVRLSGATSATLGTADGTGTITDDDGEPALAIDGPSVGEGDSGSASLTFTVTLNAVSGKPVTVTYADAGTGTATNGTDYTALTTGTLTFAAGVTSQAVTVSVTGDTTDEEDETVVVTLSGATNATLGTASGTGTITDDDGQPALAISSPSVGEGDSGAASLTFTVSLNAVSGRPVTVTYADAGTGTATSGTDYTALTAGTLTFAAGVTSRAVTVSVTGDTTDEEDETVVVRLSGATNATLGTASGTGTITDDDGAPALTISSPSVGEGDSGAASLTFTVSLNAVSGKPVTVGYADAGTGTATSGTDYTALTAGTLTFAAGVTSQAVTVSVTGDTTAEEDETVIVRLSGATNATLGTASGTGTITDDDGEPALAISSPSVGEGDSGAAGLTFTVTLNAVSGKPVTVTYADAGTGTATSGTDYTALTTGTLTFAAGTTSHAVTVSVTGDTTDEEDETVVVRLSGATSATLGTASGTGTITDDDGEPALTISSPSVGEGDSGAASLTFTVTLSAVSGRPVTVTYADAGTGTATSGTDYTALTAGTLTFAAGVTSRAVTVSVTGDTTDEEDETVIVRLSGATNATLGTASGTGTITDDDGQPALAISSPSVGEGDSGAAALTFTVSLNAVSGKPVTVTYADAGTGTATSGTDYTALPAGTLTFAAGTTSQAVTVSVTGDTTDEEDETVVVRLSGATNATLGTASGTGTITDDDGAPALTISSPSVGEGDSGAASLTFTVSLNAVSGKPVTVGYADAGTGTATSGTDYTALTAGTLTFAAGVTSQAVTVSVTGDTTDEEDETVVVRLSGATNATLGTASGTGTIADDDGAPALAISSPSVGEGDSGSASLTFTVSLNAVSGKPVTVGYADAGTGTATSGTDYTALPAGTLTFAAGTTSQAVTVSVTGDTTDEEDETVVVTLSGATNATLGTASGPGTITDDDGEPALTISSPSVGEGDSGAASLTFTVSLNAVSGKPVTVGYADAGTGTATSGTDYTALPAGTLTFAAGTTSQAVTVSVTGDTTDEEDETVVVTLSGATNATLGTASGTGTITDDDGEPALAIDGPSVGEGASGAADLTFTVSLNAVSGKPVTVNYADAGTGTATSGTDYTALPTGTLTFAAGVTSQAVTVSVTGDTTDEADETVIVSLSGATNATLGTASGTGTITDDDAEPALAISSPSVGEGDSGAASLTFTVTLNAVSGKPVTVNYADAGTGTATSGTDYTALPTGTLTFAAGVTSQTVTVSVTGDTTDEADETVIVSLSGATNATLGTASGTGTITDDDAEPALAISSPSVGEGDSGAASLTFTVTLNAVSGKPVTVNYADAGTGTATSGTDYTALPTGTLTFAAGVTSQTVTVSVTGDTTDEEDETVVVTLSGATNATLGTASGTGTITDDDAEPALAISSPSVGEGDSGSARLTFTVSLNAVSGKPVTVGYADAGTGTATSGTDYTALPTGTLTFAAGVTSQAVTVSVTGDTTDEEDETVVVRLSGATNATLGTADGTGTITDDDGEPALAISSPSVGEGDSGAASLTFTVSLNAVSGKPVTVGYADAGTGTATSGTDYTALTAGRLTFAAGVTSQAVTVSVTGDTTDEEDETVVVRLSGATNATLGTADGTGTITDDDRQAAQGIDTPPVITDPGDRTYAQGEMIVAIPITVTDAESVPRVVVTDLPAGLSYDAASARVSGTVAADVEAGAYAVTIVADDGVNAPVTLTFTITVTAPVPAIDTPPVITDPGDRTYAQGEMIVAIPITVTDAESVPRVVVTGLPAGLSYDAASARVSGTVTADVEAGTYAVTITADDGVNAPVTLTFMIMVAAPVVDLMPTFGQQTILDRSWRQHQPIPGFTLPAATGGDAPLRYELRPALPAGVMRDAETRHVSGTPTVAAETTAYTWTATDTDGDAATLTFAVTVVADLEPTFAATVPAQRYWTGLPISPLTLPAATGGDAPLTYRLTPPAGLTFDAQTRTLAGTPAVVVEEADWTLRATDADGDTAELTFRLAVRPQIVVTVGDAEAEEGAVLTFPVRLSAAAPTNVSVTWTTTPGTAQPGEDYRASAAGRQFIPAGTRRATLEVRTMDDTVIEPTETFSIRLAAAGLPVGVTLGEVEATGTITDDDLARGRRRALGPVLAGVGRTIATDTVDVIGQRFRGTVPTGRTTLGGQVLTLDRRRGDWRAAGRVAYGVARALGVEVVPPLAGDTGRMGVAGGWGLLTRPVKEGWPAAGWEMGDREAGARNPGVGFDAFGDGPLFEPGGAWDGLGQRGFDRAHAGRAQVGGWGLRRPLRFRRVTGGEMLSGSEFVLPFRPLPGIEHAPPAYRETLHAEDPLPGERGLPAAAGAFPGTTGWTLWGRGTASGFDGKPKDGFAMNGRVFSGYVGLDYRWQSEALLGVAVAHSRGEVDYETAAVTEGDVTLRLTSVLPYAHWTPRPGLGVWGLLGAGWGKAAVEDEYGRVKTDLEMLMAAVGARQEVLTWRQIDVAVKADAFLTELETDAADGLPKTAGDAQRARLMLEGRTVRALSAGSEVVPRLEVGGRWDAGKAETGFGAELGGGLEYRHRPLGLGIEARGRYLLAHQRAAFDEWGASLTLTLDPGRAKRGLWLTLAPVWGDEASEVERMWGSAEGLRAGADRAAAGGFVPDRLELDLGYGRATHEGAGVLTTYGGLAVTGPGRHGYRLGGWLAVGESVDVSVEGEREERAGGAAHAVTVAGHLRW